MTYDPAFPVQNTHYETTEPGMLLRDYFAAKAMQSYIAKADIEANIEDIAYDAYSVADSMLEVRSKK